MIHKEQSLIKLLTKKNNVDFVVMALSLISLLWIVLYKTLLLRRYEIFPYANEVGDISYGILSSTLASGIFYFFVVYLDRKKKEIIINKIVLDRLKSIRVGLFIIKQHVFPILGLNYNDDIPELDEFMKICKVKGIDFRTNAPNIPNTTEQPITWYDYFNYFFQSDKYNSQLLYEHIIYLDIELVDLLNELQYPVFQRALNSFRANDRSHNLQGTPGPFWTYLKILESFSRYCGKLEKVSV